MIHFAKGRTIKAAPHVLIITLFYASHDIAALNNVEQMCEGVIRFIVWYDFFKLTIQYLQQSTWLPRPSRKYRTNVSFDLPDDQTVDANRT